LEEYAEQISLNFAIKNYLRRRMAGHLEEKLKESFERHKDK
jgi:hypothetical protein